MGVLLGGRDYLQQHADMMRRRLADQQTFYIGRRFGDYWHPPGGEVIELKAEDVTPEELKALLAPEKD